MPALLRPRRRPGADPRRRGHPPPVLETVRRGWDRLSWYYRPPRRRNDCFGHTEQEYAEWLRPLRLRLPRGARILDLGCGSGEPAARLLSRRFQVLGVDLSGVQIRRARAAVPSARFLRADMTAVRFPPGSFEAVVALYSLIHVPVARQPPLLRRIRRWLTPGGLFVAVLGHSAWTGREKDWLGAGVEMYWSHADATTYRQWLEEDGFQVLRQRFVPEGDSGHELFVARAGSVRWPRKRPSATTSSSRGR